MLGTLWALAASADNRDFRSFSTDEGLPQLSVMALTQDPAGRLWVGTQAGLARFDGVTFETVGVEQGLPNGFVSALTVGPRGEVLAATRLGLSVYDDATGRFHTVASFSEARPGFVQLVTVGPLVWCVGPTGLARWDGERLTPVESLAAAAVFRVAADARGRLWVATDEGLFHLEGPGWNAALRRSGAVSTVAEDREGGVLVAMRDGLVLHVSAEGAERARFSLEPVWGTARPRVMLVDRRGDLWLGGTAGLVRRTGERLERIDRDSGFPWFEVSAMVEDRDGFPWFGAFGALVQRTNLAFTRFDTASGLGADSTRPIVRDGRGVLWVGTSNGLGRQQGERFTSYSTGDGLSHHVVLSLAAHGDDALYVGTAVGLDERVGDRFRRVPGFDWPWAVTSLGVQRDGTVWAITEGLGLVRGRAGAFAPVPIPGHDAREGRLFVDTKDRVWVTGRGGLVRLDGDAVSRWGVAEGLRSATPRTVTVGADGTVWLGYADALGLTRFDGARFTHWTTADGLAHDTVFSLGVDLAGQVWVGSARGVDRFDGMRFRNWARREGYPSAESNGPGFFADADGTLWFSTAEGLAHYAPERDEALEAPAPATLRALRPGTEAAGNAWVGEVVVATTVDPSRVEVESQLDDGPWTTVRGRRVELRGVSPGAHTLLVRARRYGGPWSVPSRQAFVVAPPFWRTWSFFTAVVVALGLVGWGLAALRLRRLRAEARQLDIEVSQRTAALGTAFEALNAAKERLEAMNDELRAANAAKSAFLANMSHEIRTPMNAVVGMASLLDETPLSAEQREYVDTLRGSAELLLGVLNDVLDFSKIEAGKLTLEKAPTELRPLFHEVGAQVASAAAEKGLALAVVVHREVPAVLLADAVRLKQIVLNLLSNAVKFTSAGEVVLRVSVRPEGLSVTVRDTGIGMSPEVQAQLFQPFTQADASTTRRFGGTGLGLSISRSLAVAMGGTLGVTSAAGEGSTFHLVVPVDGAQPLITVSQGVRLLVQHHHSATREGVVEAVTALGYEVVDDERTADLVLSDADGPRRPRVLLSRLGVPAGNQGAGQGFSGVLSLPARPAHIGAVVAQALRASAAPPPPSPAVASRWPGRVLVAEDNPINQQVILRMLEKLGLRADLAHDGLDAVAAVERGDYAMVLMDCQMPRCDGYDAARAIRALPGLRGQVPIVAVTASALEDERERCLAAGIDDYLPKPIRLTDLERVLTAWLSPRGTDRRGPVAGSALASRR